MRLPRNESCFKARIGAARTWRRCTPQFQAQEYQEFSLFRFPFALALAARGAARGMVHPTFEIGIRVLQYVPVG